MPKKIDVFTKNIIIVFAGASLANFFNLLYQLLIAHKLSPQEFASFNSLLAIFTIISAPLAPVQLAVAKYSAEFSAHNQISKIKFLLSELFKKIIYLSAVTFFIFLLFSGYIIKALKIHSASSGYILAALVASSLLSSVLLGGVQGLEFFAWLASNSIITGALKLCLAFMAIKMGFNIAGALGALLISVLFGIIITYYPLRKFITFRPVKESINYKEILTYLFPVALSSSCLVALVNFDMILVKYFFPLNDSGLYSLAQMVGKIFLFLPAAISLVMFPKTSGLNAQKMDTTSTLKRSLLYVFSLCILAYIIYSLFPSLVLKVLTGKVEPESALLGRLFGISMSFFALLNTMVYYFLSIKDFRFIRFLVLSTLLESLAIVILHKSLIQVQLILCINSALLFCICLLLVFAKNKFRQRRYEVPLSS